MSFAHQLRYGRILLVSALVLTSSFRIQATTPDAGSETHPVQTAAGTNRANLQLAQSYGRLPLSFVANGGQADGRVKFLAKGSGYGLYLTADAAVLSLEKSAPECAAKTAGTARVAAPANAAGCRRETAAVSMRLAGDASKTSQPQGEALLPGTANYFVGSDAAGWHAGVPTFARVRYSNVYPGVDLVYYGSQRELEYDFAVAPHADPNAIRLQFSGVSALKLDADGSLTVSAGQGNVTFRKPLVYQVKDGHRELVAGRFTLGKRHSVGFQLGGYDHERPLVIDPVLSYSTYVGGAGVDGDEALAIAVDASGDAYITGQTDSSNFPVTTGVLQSKNLATASTAFSGFVTKLNATGTAVVYSTYLGGAGSTQGTAIAVDSSGDAYITGTTSAANYPTTTGAYQTASHASASGFSAFVSKLNPTGTALLWSTYLGGSGNGSGTGDTAFALALDSANDVYVAGFTNSKDFPTTAGAFQTTNLAYANEGSDAFVSKLNPAGSALLWSTYLGGSAQNAGGDIAYALAVSSAGNVYVAGAAGSTDFPVTAGAYQTSNPAAGSGSNAAFVTELNSTGTGQVYSTYLGGSQTAFGAGLAVDASGNAYVAGSAYSSDYPTTSGAYQTTDAAEALAASNVFVTKLNPTGTALVYSTLLGGSGAELSAYVTNGDYATALALDSSGDAYVTGGTWSSNFPVTSGALQSTNAGAANTSFNAFVTEINPKGTALVYSTYLGGEGFPFGDMGYYRGDQGAGLVLDASGNIYIGGVTYSPNYPTTSGAYQTGNKATGNSGSNAFVSKISVSSGVSPAISQAATVTTIGSSTTSATVGTSITFTASVAATAGSTVPTGSVTFTVDGATASTATLSGGAAAYSTASLAAGSHTVAASFAGSSAFAASASSSLAVTVTTPVAAAPAFSPAVGTYSAAQSVTLSSATSAAAIYYTTNGTTPTTASSKYSAAIPVSASTTISSIAVATGYSNSVVAAGTYTIAPTVASPKLSLAAGTYATTQSVTITDTAAGATIYYTTNGTTPTTSSTKYAAAISVSATETIKAFAVLAGDTNSAVVSATYTITPTVSTPVFSLAAGTYATAQTVTISDATAGATIYYTTNGTTPTTSSTKYSTAIKVSATETLEAIAVLSGYNTGTVATAKYTITPTVATPTFSLAAGTYTATQSVKLSVGTLGATIYYTTNGTTPTTSSTKYTAAISVSATETIEAMAVLSGYTNSAVASAKYTISAKAAAAPGL